MLRQFGVLPSEARAREMTDGDYLYCLLQMRLDDEEEVSRLCPECRERAERVHCPVCGAETGLSGRGENPHFDPERFRKLKEGKA